MIGMLRSECDSLIMQQFKALNALHSLFACLSQTYASLHLLLTAAAPTPCLYALRPAPRVQLLAFVACTTSVCQAGTTSFLASSPRRLAAIEPRIDQLARRRCLPAKESGHPACWERNLVEQCFILTSYWAGSPRLGPSGNLLIVLVCSVSLRQHSSRRSGKNLQHKMYVQ